MRPIHARNDTFRHLGLCVRPVRPCDRKKLINGFTRLSPESRYRRFFGTKSRLTDEDLRTFSQLDEDGHFALGALEISEAGDEGDAIGIARFIRLTEHLEIAELSVAVVDDWQRRGIGRLLLQRLALAACERGVKRFHGSILAENEPMRELARSIFGRTILQRDGSVLKGNFPIPDCEPATPP